MILAQISDSCGLTTYNKDGTPCYSRAINEHLEAIGAIHCDRVWDETTGSWIPNLIWVSELFFTLIGYEYGKYEAAQQQQLAWENKGLKEKGEPAISLTEARRRAKVKHIQTAFEVRAKKRAFKTQLRQARKLAAMEKQKAQAKILNDLAKLYSQDELAAMGHVELKRQVEHRYAAMYAGGFILPEILFCAKNTLFFLPDPSSTVVFRHHDCMGATYPQLNANANKGIDAIIRNRCKITVLLLLITEKEIITC